MVTADKRKKIIWSDEETVKVIEQLLKLRLECNSNNSKTPKTQVAKLEQAQKVLNESRRYSILYPSTASVFFSRNKELIAHTATRIHQIQKVVTEGNKTPIPIKKDVVLTQTPVETPPLLNNVEVSVQLLQGILEVGKNLQAALWSIADSLAENNPERTSSTVEPSIKALTEKITKILPTNLPRAALFRVAIVCSDKAMVHQIQRDLAFLKHLQADFFLSDNKAALARTAMYDFVVITRWCSHSSASAIQKHCKNYIRIEGGQTMIEQRLKDAYSHWEKNGNMKDFVSPNNAIHHRRAIA